MSQISSKKLKSLRWTVHLFKNCDPQADKEYREPASDALYRPAPFGKSKIVFQFAWRWHIYGYFIRNDNGEVIYQKVFENGSINVWCGETITLYPGGMTLCFS